MKLANFQVGQLIPACARTLESTSSRVNINPSWSRVNRTLARRLFKTFLSLRQQVAPGCQKKFLGTYCPVLYEILYSQSNSPLEDEKIILLYCGLEVYRVRSEMNYWLNVSTNKEPTRLCHRWNDSCFLWYKPG